MFNPGALMNRQTMEWKLDADRLWPAATLDFHEAERIAAEIFTLGAETALRQAAAQALPSLRNAALENADRSTKDEARRRFSVIRDVLHALDAGTFGRRDSARKPLTEEERYRRLLGLPLGRRLARAEIHRAWKRAAKSAHPDAGGNASEFVALSAAQDALMKER
jgi:hypothetical protein